TNGCVSLNSSNLDERQTFSPLLEADLATFHHRLMLEYHLGQNDEWSELGQSFIELASCDPIHQKSQELRQNPDANLLNQLVHIEDARRLRLISQAKEENKKSWHQNTIHVQFTSRSYFNREALSPDENLIQWPKSHDIWQDEWPAAD